MGIGNGMKVMKLPSPGGGGGKWAAIAVVAASPLAIFFIVPVILMLIIGITVSVVTGTTAAMLGSDEVQHGGDGCMIGGVTGNQTEHVRTVIGVAKALDISKKGAIIATMTMMAETGIQNIANDGKTHGSEDGASAKKWLDIAALSMNYPHDLYNGQPAGSDNDSIGLFQQRISGSWATLGNSSSSNDPEAAVQRLLNPVWTAQAFFGGDKSPPSRPGMLEIAPDYERRADWGSVAQDVQVSAYPDAYNRFKSQATQLVNQNWDSAPKASLIGIGDTGSDDSGADGSGDSGGSGGGSSSFTMPLKGENKVNSDFGPRSGGYHHGVDLDASEGTPIYAVADGTVSTVGSNPGGWGNYLVIDHRINGKKYASLYAHQTDGGIKVAAGATIEQGQRVGTVGWTGNVIPAGPNGAHLHLEIHEGGFNGSTANAIDPWPLLQGQPPGGAEGGGCGGGSGAPPGAFPGGDPDKLVDDPSSNGKITARLHHLYEQTETNYPETGWGCYSDRGANNPTSEHDDGRACDITFGNRIGQRPNDQQLKFGWDVTNWMKENAETLGVEYLIWQGKIWSVSRDAEGWRPYGGGGMHNPSDITGGHYDHLHVTVKAGG